MSSFGDFNRVNTNVTALSAQLSLNKINSELGDSRLKLSTGKRINSAEDDSAGYAIATKLISRVKGLEQALQNVSDAKSMLDVVEGAYTSIIDNLIDLIDIVLGGSEHINSHVLNGATYRGFFPGGRGVKLKKRFGDQAIHPVARTAAEGSVVAPLSLAPRTCDADVTVASRAIV